MPEENGDYLSRFERLERLSEQHTKQIGELVSHAAGSDRRIEILRESQLETNTQIKSLLGAWRDLIERIPPENLR